MGLYKLIRRVARIISPCRREPGTSLQIAVLLGAGASPQLLGTQKLTSLLEQCADFEAPDSTSPFFASLAARLHEVLDDQAEPASINFEQLIDVADELAHCLRDPHSVTSLNRWRLYQFFRVHESRVAWEQSKTPLRQIAERARIYLLNEMAAAVDALDRAPPLVSGLSALSQDVVLKLSSLNYDDLPFLTNIRWVTGFNDAGAFDPATEWEHGDHTLPQLHGSVRWATIGSNMIWFHSRDDARKEWGTIGQMSAARGYQDGRIAPYSPMITGLRKADAIIDEPYATYFHLFRRQFFSCNRWLIIGYGFADRHINSVLRHAWTAWRRRSQNGQPGLKVAVVDWRPTRKWRGRMGWERPERYSAVTFNRELVQ